MSGLNLSIHEQNGAPRRATDTARLDRLIRRSVRLQEALTETTSAFFGTRPFKMIAQASATEPGRDVYSFKMDRSIPWKIRWLTRRLLKVLRRLADALPERPADGALEKVRCYSTPWLRPSLVAGARAATELQLDGSVLPGATMSAPTWSPSTREVSVVGHDPGGGLKGRVEVRFQLELSGQRYPAQRQSVVALTGAAIWEAQQILERAEASRNRPRPVQAGPREARGDDERSA